MLYIYIYIHPPTSPERRACETPPPSLQHPALSNSQPSKQGPAEEISPASPGSQAAEIEESYPPGSQAAGIQDLGARMLNSSHLIILSSSIGDLLARKWGFQAANLLKSSHLIILSSSLGDLLARHRPPQDATGCQTLWLRIQQISSNGCSRLHRSAK